MSAITSTRGSADASDTGTGPPRNLIEFRDVSLRFGSEVVYAGLDLEIREGEFFCLLGPSGCGKSTALRILAGLLAYDGGSVSVNGASPNERWRDIAFVFQNPRLLPWRTAKEKWRSAWSCASSA